MKNTILKFENHFYIHIILLSISLSCSINYINAQTRPTPSSKIKVYLVGTFHFNASDSDVIKGEKVDMSTSKNQKELEVLVNKLQKTKADKVFIEWRLNRQSFVDSTYNLYRNNQFKLGNNEAYQLGYRLAKKLNHARVYCADAGIEWKYDSALAYASRNGQKNILESGVGKPITDSIGLVMLERIEIIMNSKEPKRHYGNTLTDQFIRMNDSIQDRSAMAKYLLFFPRVGSNDNYIGADLAGDFYKRNVRIYTNLLRQVDFQRDTSVVLIIGTAHVPFLKSILQNNYLFEVADVTAILTN